MRTEFGTRVCDGSHEGVNIEHLMSSSYMFGKFSFVVFTLYNNSIGLYFD